MFKRIMLGLRQKFKVIVHLILVNLVNVLFKKNIDYPLPDKTKRIAIPLVYGIGDAIMFTPALKQLQEVFINAEVTIFSNVPCIDVLKSSFPHFKYVLYKKIINQRRYFDLLISPQPSLHSLLAAIWLAPKNIMGYNFTSNYNHSIAYYKNSASILKHYGAKDVTPELYPTVIQHNIADHFLEKNKIRKPYICFIMGGRWASRTYSVKHYHDLLELMRQADIDAPVILIGGTIEGMEAITDRKLKDVYDATGQTSLDEVMGLISLSHLIIGPDSGLLNIAIAFQKDNIGIYGPVAPKLRAPDHYLESAVYQKRCLEQPCYNIGDYSSSICKYQIAECMNIAPEIILTKIKKYMVVSQCIIKSST